VGVKKENGGRKALALKLITELLKTKRPHITKEVIDYRTYEEQQGVNAMGMN